MEHSSSICEANWQNNKQDISHQTLSWIPKPDEYSNSVLFQRILQTHSNATTRTGVPNLSLTMYPFSIPTDEHVPLQHFNR